MALWIDTFSAFLRKQPFLMVSNRLAWRCQNKWGGVSKQVSVRRQNKWWQGVKTGGGFTEMKNLTSSVGETNRYFDVQGA